MAERTIGQISFVDGIRAPVVLLDNHDVLKGVASIVVEQKELMTTIVTLTIKMKGPAMQPGQGAEAWTGSPPRPDPTGK